MSSPVAGQEVAGGRTAAGRRQDGGSETDLHQHAAVSAHDDLEVHARVVRVAEDRNGELDD